MRKRLRDAYTPAELRRVYETPHDHRRWADHITRVDVTVAFAKTLLGTVSTVADLSCGNGSIANGLGAETTYLGDYAPGYPIHGPIEETLGQIPRVDAFVLSETLEHLDEPEPVLRHIRMKSAALVLSTPVDCWNDPNPEHYWAWDREGVEELLTASGWRVQAYTALDLRPMTGAYCFGIWVCR